MFVVGLNDERRHTYQRERVSITGLRLNVGKGLKPGRLIGVAVSRLVSLSSLAV